MHEEGGKQGDVAQCAMGSQRKFTDAVKMYVYFQLLYTRIRRSLENVLSHVNGAILETGELVTAPLGHPPYWSMNSQHHQ